MPPAPATPAEAFAALLRGLTHAVVTRGLIGLLASPLVSLIVDRIREINQRVARIAARVREGRYARRVAVSRQPAANRPRRRKSPLPQSAWWLVKLVPEAAGPRGQLEFLLRDPGMAELMAAAPVSLGRPIRSLCRMLGVEVPPVIAPPARPKKPRPARPPKPRPPPRPQPELPAWMRIGPPRKPWSMARIRGSPKRP